MEPPHKRQRLSQSTVPAADLEKRRARNDNRLKSIFESIFDKYSKDFNGIGDEIDLRTGEIVVDNGHLLRMTTERDAGQVESVYGEVGRDYSSVDEAGVSGQNFDGGGAAPSSESDSCLLHTHCVDCDTLDLETGPLSTTFEQSLHGQIVAYESEEDELADNAIEWVTPREARAIAHQKWQLPSDGPAFIDESIVEEIWRAPALPQSTPPCLSVQKARLVTDKVHKSTGLVDSGFTLWASVGRPPRRPNLAQSPALRQRAVPLTVADGLEVMRHDSSHSPGNRRNMLWTEKEERLLLHLKHNTTLTFREMNSYFPNRHRESIASKWTQMVSCGKASQAINQGFPPERRPTSPSAPCSAWLTSGDEHVDDAQVSPEADVLRNYSTNTFASEMSGLVQEPADGYFRPCSRDVATFSQSSNLTISANTSSEYDSATLANGRHLLDELQRGFRAQYPPDSRDKGVGRTTRASPTPLFSQNSGHRYGHVETGVHARETRQRSLLDNLQIHNAAHTPPSHSQRVENDAKLRKDSSVEQNIEYASGFAFQQAEDNADVPRNESVDQIVEYRSIVDPTDELLPQAEPAGQAIGYESASESVAAGSARYHSSGLHESETGTLVSARPAENYLDAPAFPQENASSVPLMTTPRYVTRSLRNSAKSGKIMTPICGPIGISSGVSYAVQVLIPRSKSYEVCQPSATTSGPAEEPVALSASELAQHQPEIVMPGSTDPGRSLSPPNEETLHSKGDHDVEIPDSQPELSSPIALNDEEADSIMIQSQSSIKTSSLARHHTDQPSKQTVSNIDTPDSDFDDELSMLTLRPKRLLGTSAIPSPVTPHPSKVVIPRVAQARRKLGTKLTNATIANSFSSFPSDMMECSEDELSFK